MTLKSLYKNNKAFFICFILFALSGLSVIIFYSKAEGFYLFNFYHSAPLDDFFIYYTDVGDGFFCVVIALLLFIFKKRYLSLMVFASYAVSGIIAQGLKYFILEARPALYLKSTSYKYFIENVTLHNFHAFPSGHTASAFAMAAILSFDAKNKNYSILFLLLAALVGYSRIYLAQHFMDDVLSGAVIGILSSIACWMLLDKTFNRILLYKRN
jgi:membrane-associated phospholipid phosphatase